MRCRYKKEKKNAKKKTENEYHTANQKNSNRRKKGNSAMRKGGKKKKTDQLLRPREEVLCVEIKVRTENGKRAIRSLTAVLSLIFRGRKSRCCRCSLYHLRQIEMSTADVQRRFFQDPSRETVAWQTRFFCNYNQQEEEKGKRRRQNHGAAEG